MSVKMRQEVEQKILAAFVDSAIAANRPLTVSLERGYDLDECLIGSLDREKILEAAYEGDECHIFVHEAEVDFVVDDHLDSLGWVYFVWGNDGWDCISDYIAAPAITGLLVDAKKISDHYAG